MESVNENEMFDLFQKYEKDMLEKSEKLQFEEMLASDSSFKQMYDDFVVTNSIIKSYTNNHVKNLLKNLDYDSYEKSFFDRNKNYIIGLLLILTVTSIVYFAYSNLSKNNAPIVGSEKTKSNNVIISPKISSIKQNDLSTKEIESKEIVRNKKIYNRLSQNSNSNELDKLSSNPNLQTIVAIDNQKKLNFSKDTLINSSFNNRINSKVENKATCNIDFNVSTFETCENVANGKIIIDKIVGAKLPYKLKINDEPIVQINSLSYELANLRVGEYNLTLISNDDKSCYKEVKNVIIKSLPNSKCVEEINDVINISLKTKYHFKEFSTSRKLKIYDLSGKIVLEKNINANDTFEWEGDDNLGNTLPAAIYFVSVFNNQGDLISQGSITIVAN